MKDKIRYGHPRFYELLNEMAKLYNKKSHDYAGTDPLSNLKQCKAMGIPPWKGVIIRLGDKFSRLCEFVKKGKLEVKNESIIDTLMDNAIYSLLAIILLEQENN